MNLRSIANAAITTVNPNERVGVMRSDGYEIGAGARQVPKYAPVEYGPAQIQALDGNDLKQLDGLNIQGTIRAIYLYGNIAGTVRPEQIGGDLITRKNGEESWLVVKVLESWPKWTKAAIVLQDSTNDRLC